MDLRLTPFSFLRLHSFDEWNNYLKNLKTIDFLKLLQKAIRNFNFSKLEQKDAANVKSIAENLLSALRKRTHRLGFYNRIRNPQNKELCEIRSNFVEIVYWNQRKTYIKSLFIEIQSHVDYLIDQEYFITHILPHDNDHICFIESLRAAIRILSNMIVFQRIKKLTQ